MGSNLSNIKQREYLIKMGFDTIDVFNIDNVNDISNININEYTKCDIDGLVIKYNGENKTDLGPLHIILMI